MAHHQQAGALAVDVYTAILRARSDPIAFAAFLEDRIQCYTGMHYYPDTIVRQLKRILQITIEVWGSESTELVACWLTGLMDAVVGEYSWNDAVQIDVPDVLEMQQPGVLRATKSVRS